MTASHVHLDTLPLEVIQRVLWYGDCEAALAISRVSHQFHDICKDSYIFKQIVAYGNGHPFDTQTVWRQPSQIQEASDTTTCAQWALADSKAIQVMKNLHHLDSNCFSWFPTVVAMHHPVVNHMAFPTKYPSLPSPASLQSMQALSFAFACHILCRSAENSSHLGSKVHAFLSFCSSQLTLKFDPHDLLQQHLDSLHNHDYENLGTVVDVEVIHFEANLAVAQLSHSLSESIRRNELRQDGSTPSARNLNPPHPFNIPFAQILQINPPYSINSSKDFGYQSMTHIFTPEFVSSGSWVGYYCYAPRRRNLVFDTMMDGIRFQVTPGTAGNSKQFHLRSGGQDQHGFFVLDGQMSASTGLITMIKRYNSGVRWPWHAVLTPFGLVGSWGERGWGGWFWLWKESWSTKA